MSELSVLDKKKAKSEQTSENVSNVIRRDLEDVNGAKGGMLPDDVSSHIQRMRGSGRPLSGGQLKRYSEQFGRDMSDVRIHTDAESDTVSRSLNARAFTIGSDVFLTKGINPEGGGRDQQTISHELTHVVQQNGRAGSGALRLGAADTPQEHEAEATAQREYAPETNTASDPQTAENAVQREESVDLENKTEPEAVDVDSKTAATADSGEDGTVRRETDDEEIESRNESRSGTSIQAGNSDMTANTVQRGFWGDLASKAGELASKAGEDFLAYTGLDEALNDFSSGEKKVKAALDGMEDPDKEKFEELSDKIKDLEENRLPEADEKSGGARASGIASDISSVPNSLSINDPGEKIPETEQDEDQFDDLYEEYEDALHEQLTMLQKVDESITEEDYNRYRGSAHKSLWGSVTTALKANFWSGFQDAEKQEAYRQNMISEANNQLAGKSRSIDKTKTDRANRRNVIKAVWTEVQGHKELKEKYQSWLMFRSEMTKKYSDVIEEGLQEGKSVNDIKEGMVAALEEQAKVDKKKEGKGDAA